MQVTQTNADGLKHEFKVVVPAGHLEEKVSVRLAEVGRTVRIPGFRPGKVPMGILRKKYGSSVMGEVLEATVNNGTQHALEEHKLRPVVQPKVQITSFEEGSDLEFTIAVETLPEVKVTGSCAAGSTHRPIVSPLPRTCSISSILIPASNKVHALTRRALPSA